MSRHQCRPTCPACVAEIVRARNAARAELLPRLTRTVRVTYTAPKEGHRESAAA